MTDTLVRPAARGSALRESPYVGLIPYSEDDAPFFFGREREKKIITANLKASRLTLLYGASGVGKTSVLLAGVVHDLRQLVAKNRLRLQRAVREGPARDKGQEEETERAPFAVAVFRSWRDEPLADLLEVVRRAAIEALPDGKLQSWPAGEPVVDTLRAWSRRVRTLLVVLDQFEDYFYLPREAGPGTFGFELPQILGEPNLRVNFLLAIREDELARLDAFKRDIPFLFGNRLRVEYMDRDAGRRAIRGPIEKYNELLPAGAEPFSIEEGLVETVLDQVATGRLALTETGASPFEDGALAAV